MAQPNIDFQIAPTLVFTADALSHFAIVGCLKQVLQLSADKAFVTRIVLDTVTLNTHPRSIGKYLRCKALRPVTLTPTEARRCTQMWLEGWPGDLASSLVVVAERGWTLVYSAVPLLPSTFAPLQMVSSIQILLQLAERDLLSLEQADHYLLLMKEQGLNSPLAAIDRLTLQRWQRHELQL